MIDSQVKEVAKLLSQTFSADSPSNKPSGSFSLPVVQSLGRRKSAQTHQRLFALKEKLVNSGLQMTESERSKLEGEIHSADLERKLWEMFDAAANIPSMDDDSEEGWVTFSGACSSQLGRICHDKLDEHESFQPSGRISDIGKFLLDPDSIDIFERIISSKHVSKFAKTIEDEHAMALNRLQDYMLCQDNVLATIVIGHDGTVMSSRGDSNADNCCKEKVSNNESIASWALCAYVNTKIASQLFGAHELKHLVMNGPCGTTILSDFGQALLITITKSEECEAVNKLLRKLDALLK